MFEDFIINFFKEYKCDTTILRIILNCKKKLREKMFVEPIRVETSIKKFDNGKISKNRYIISLYLNEFKLYDYDDQKNIFEILGFDIKNFDLNSYNNFQLYLSCDNNIGKIYFSNMETIICYQSNKIIKYYKLRFPGWLDVSLDKNFEKLHAIQVRITRDNKVNWYGLGKDFITIYYRPNINYDEKYLKKQNSEFLNYYKFYKHWYYHECMCKDCSLIDLDKKLRENNIKLLINATNELKEKS